MSEVLKVPKTVLLIKDQRACVNNWSKAMHVGGVESGVCGFYTTLHTEYCYSCRRCWRLLYSVYSGLSPLPGGKAIWAFHLGGLAVRRIKRLCMSEVLKVHTGPSIQSNVTHVEGVKSSSICTIRAVMLCMSKVLKVAQNNWGMKCLCMSKVSKEHTHIFTHSFLNN